MTAVSPDRRPLAFAPRPPRLDWTMVMAIGGALAGAAGVVSSFATLSDRVAHLEANVPAGAIQRLDERTVQMQAALIRLEARQ